MQRQQHLRMLPGASADSLFGMSADATSPPQHSQDADALVVYASTHGHTAKIARRIVDAMRSERLTVDLLDVEHAADADPARYDLVVVGGSVHKQHHQKQLVDWVRDRRDALEGRRSVFFSVSLSAAEDGAEARAATQGCIDAFSTETGWTPARTQTIAGCLQYREYDFFTRQLMRLLMKHMGHPTDASHDYEYTDWDAVDRFAHEIAMPGAAA